MSYANILFLLLFLLAHLGAQIFIPSVKGKNIALLAASFLFYAWTGPVNILVILALSLVGWLLGLQLRRTLQPGTRRGLYILGLVLIAGTLLVWRYTDFILGSSRALFGRPETLPELVVPLGIGIYTLQLMAYLKEVYEKETPAETSFFRLLIWSSLFYGCMGGPLLRYANLKKSLKSRSIRPTDLSRGVTRICIGIAKRFLLADSLGILVDQYLVRSPEGLAAVPVTGLWVGVILTALQMYLRFSAYADVAVGLGLMTGLPVPENFAYPFLSYTVTGFISKWFITVGDFFRDFVQTPIGARKRRPLLGAVLCYMLMGLWYGGSWTYLLWGLFVALCLFLEQRYLYQLRPGVGGLLGVLALFWSFVFLSFTTLERFGIGLKGLFGLNHNGFFSAATFAGFGRSLPLIIVCILFCVPLGTLVHNLWRNIFKDKADLLTAGDIWEAAYPILLLALTAFWVLRGSGKAFLTF